jgi:tape measure domain-containing protein
MAEIKITADTSQANRAIDGLSKALGALTGVLGAGALAQQFVKITSDLQEMSNKLTFATGSIDKANAAFQILSQTSKNTGSNLGGTIDLFSKLAQSATFQGSSTEALAQITENFNKTLQISGASGAGAASALYQFAQAMTKGSLNGDEFRTIMETNGYLMAVLEKQTGKSRAELIQMASQGKLSAEILGRALYENSKITEDYAKNIRTIPQAYENLQTSIAGLVNQFNKVTGVGEKFVKVMDYFAKNEKVLLGVFIGLTAAALALAAALIPAAAAVAVITGGLAIAGAAAVGGLFGLWAQHLDDAQKKSDELNQSQAETNRLANAGNKEGSKGLVTTKQKTTLEMDYNKKLNDSLNALIAANKELGKETGYRSLQLEIEKAVSAEKEKAKAAGGSISAQQLKILKTETERKILGEEELGIKKDLLSLQSQINIAGVSDAGQRQVLAQLEAYRLKLTKETYDAQKGALATTIENSIVESAKLSVSEDIKKAQNDLNNLLIVDSAQRKYQETIDAAKLKYGSLYTGVLQTQTEELAKQLKLNSQIASGMGLAGKYDASILEAQYQAEQTALDVSLANKKISQEAYELAIFDLKQKYRDKEFAAREAAAAQEFRTMGYSNNQASKMAAQRNKVEKMTKEEQVQFGVETYGQMLNDLGKFNKDAFKAAKAYNIGVAIMDTYTAAGMAFKSLAMIPVVGPALGAVAAGAAIAAGMARVSAIRSQSYSGRALGGPVMGGDSYMVGENGPEIFTPNTTGSITRNSDIGGGDNVNINFNINTVDAKGFDTLLATRKPMIIQMVRTAMNDRGNRSLV